MDQPESTPTDWNATPGPPAPMPEPAPDGVVSASSPRLAGFWRRTGGYLLDSIVIWLAYAPAVVVFAIAPRSAWWVVVGGIGVLAGLAYFPLFWSRTGSTPGMALAGIRVARATDGSRLSLGRAIGRYLAYFLAIIPFYLGFLWVIWDRQKRGWHDMLAGTLVVRTEGAPVRPGRRTALIAVIGGVLTAAGFFAAVVAIAPSLYNGVRDASGRITEPMEISVFGLRVGDCFDLTDAQEVSTVLAIPCEQPHVYEAFLMTRMTGSTPPTDASLQSAVEETCFAAFERFVGHAYDTSDWFVSYIGPTAASWALNDRNLICMLNNEGYTHVRGSARDSGA